MLLPQRNRIAKFDFVVCTTATVVQYSSTLYEYVLYDSLRLSPPPPPRVLAAVVIVSVPRLSPCSSTYYPCHCVEIPGFRRSNVQVPPSSYSIPLPRRTRCPGTALCCRYGFWSLSLWRPFFRTVVEITSRDLPTRFIPLLPLPEALRKRYNRTTAPCSRHRSGATNGRSTLSRTESCWWRAYAAFSYPITVQQYTCIIVCCLSWLGACACSMLAGCG